MKKIIKVGLALSTALIMVSSFTGCNNNECCAPAPPPTDYLALFLDAPVSGLTYSSGNITDITNESGIFSIAIGETATFSLPGVSLLNKGAPFTLTAPVQDSALWLGPRIVTPIDLVPGGATLGISDPVVQELAVLLQSLDSDGVPSNGIKINTATLALLQGQTFDLGIPGNVAAGLAAVGIPAANIVTAAQATANMSASFHAASSGEYTGSYSGTCNGASVNGTWKANIDSTGALNGFATDSSTLTQMPITGTNNPLLANGFVATSGTSSWTGTSSLDGSISGTWSDPACLTAGDGGIIAAALSNNVAGSYMGTFSGTDTGSLQLTIDVYGTVTGTVSSSTYGSGIVSGTVDTFPSGPGGVAPNGLLVTSPAGVQFMEMSLHISNIGGINGNWGAPAGTYGGTLTGFKQ